MFAGETKLDEKDLLLHAKVGCWLALEWKEGVCNPPKGIPFGTHLATFVIGQYGSEIRGLNFCWLYSENGTQFHRVGKILEGIKTVWFFKYSTLKKFKIMELDKNCVQIIGLPDLSDDFHKEVPRDCFDLRRLTSLNPFRHPGYPDDVQVTSSPNVMLPETGIEVCGEQVWVRVNKMITDKEYSGSLLNNTAFTGLSKGDQIYINYFSNDRDGILYCTKKNVN
jgi:hypothetical protein